MYADCKQICRVKLDNGMWVSGISACWSISLIFGQLIEISVVPMCLFIKSTISIIFEQLVYIQWIWLRSKWRNDWKLEEIDRKYSLWNCHSTKTTKMYMQIYCSQWNVISPIKMFTSIWPVANVQQKSLSHVIEMNWVRRKSTCFCCCFIYHINVYNEFNSILNDE